MEDSVDLRDVKWSTGENCPNDKSDNSLKGPLEVAVALIGGTGGQSGSVPNWGSLSLFAPFFFSLREPSLNLFKRKDLILSAARASVRRGRHKVPLSGVPGGKRRVIDGENGGDKTEERPVSAAPQLCMGNFWRDLKWAIEEKTRGVMVTE